MLNLNARFAEQANVVAFAPLDLATTGGLATPYVSMKNYHRATLVLIKAVGSASEDPVITLDQATALAGTGTKALAAIAHVDKKQHATTLQTQGTWTGVDQAAAASFSATDGELQAIYAIDIRAEDLDQDNGFDCFRATIADVGSTAQIAALMLILWGPRYMPPLSPLLD